ncbi:Uncharacterized protein Rs2_24617 [Raphanus sativus]|nr:Uncharacterized protein Rs2_24617 [Raphanus sativus]
MLGHCMVIPGEWTSVGSLWEFVIDQKNMSRIVPACAVIDQKKFLFHSPVSIWLLTASKHRPGLKHTLVSYIRKCPLVISPSHQQLQSSTCSPHSPHGHPGAQGKSVRLPLGKSRSPRKLKLIGVVAVVKRDTTGLIVWSLSDCW